MVRKPFDIFNIFNISANWSTFLNINHGELIISAVVLENADMLKVVPFGVSKGSHGSKNV